MARFRNTSLAFRVSILSAFCFSLCSACDKGAGSSSDDEDQPSGDGAGNGTGNGDGDGDGDLGTPGDGDTTGGGGTTPGGGGSSAGGGTGVTGGTGGSLVGDGDGDISPAPTFELSQFGSVYTFAAPGSSIKVDAADGGRVISFTIGGVEALVQESSGAGQYGSVFWPSPQNWAWAPEDSIPEINNEAYTASVLGHVLTLVSANNELLDLIVTKTHTPTTTTNGTPALSITYSMQNTGDSPLNIAPWEISRVASGKAFYPTGPTARLGKSNLTVQEVGAHTWYNYDATGLSGVPKSFGDGAGGWLAWLTNGAVAMKSFPDLLQANFAPGEAEIEIYASPDGEYMEVEEQGAYVTIAPGGSSNWTVVWTGAVAPGGSDTAVGSQDLIDLVTSTL